MRLLPHLATSFWLLKTIDQWPSNPKNLSLSLSPLFLRLAQDPSQAAPFFTFLFTSPPLTLEFQVLGLQFTSWRKWFYWPQTVEGEGGSDSELHLNGMLRNQRCYLGLSQGSFRCKIDSEPSLPSSGCVCPVFSRSMAFRRALSSHAHSSRFIPVPSKKLRAKDNIYNRTSWP